MRSRGVPFHRSLQSEFRKMRGSTLGALSIAGGTLVPILILAMRLRQGDAVRALLRSEVYWEMLWNAMWESLAVLLVPTGVIVLSAVVTSHEHRANTWKQVHATPQSLRAIFAAKVVVAATFLALCFGVLLAAFWATGLVPALVHGVPLGTLEPFPWATLLPRAGEYYLDTLPIVAGQFALGLTVRQVMVPVGIGLALWMVAVTAVAARLNWVVPYAYTALDYFNETGTRIGRAWPLALPWLAVAQTLALLAVAWLVYRRRWERL